MSTVLPIPRWESAILGFVNGETSSVLSGTLSVVDSDAATTTSVGTYNSVITASGRTSTNYTITYVAGNLTVTPAPLTITANGVSRVYGAADPALGVSYSGFVNGETSSVLSGTLSVVDSDAATTTSVGTYNSVITASGRTSTNYTITYVAGNLTVTPAPLTITANGVSRIYGASDPALGASYLGFVNGETASLLGGTLSVVDSDSATTTNVGTYSSVITASGLTSTNYMITYAAGNLTVAPAPLTITASGASRVYGASDPMLGVTYSGFVNGQTSSVLSGTLSVVDSDSAPTTAVGSYSSVITASGLTSTNYTITYAAGNLTITPAPLTITASGVSRVYGASDPMLGVAYSGFVNGQTSSVLGGTLSVVDANSAATTNVGTYSGVITAFGLMSSNYTITYAGGNLTVTPAPLTITANSVSRIYGASDPPLGATYSSFVNGQTSSVLGGTLSVVDADSAATTMAGSHSGVITASGLSSTNYTITYVAGNLTVTPAPLTITANSTTKTYGQTATLASTTFSTRGLLNSDSVSSVSLSSPGAAATATVNGSPYAIIASGAIGSGLGNYTISYVNGSLTVNSAPLTITANSMTKIYGQTVTFASSAFSTSRLFNSDSVSSVSLSSTGAAATAPVSGSPYTIIATGAVGSGLENYTISYVNGTLTVIKASPTIATTPNPTAVNLGTSPVTLKDSAVLSSGYGETGSVTFTLVAPGGGSVDTETVTVRGNGTYTTPNGYTLTTGCTPIGTYQWDTTYSGDTNNNAVSDNNDQAEQVVVTEPVSAGEFATIGFWRNKNGTGVIDSFNGSSTATALGQWLATSFPNLFGSAKDPVGNLADTTNVQIASLYAGLPNNGVTNNDYIQAFAVALGIYADTSSLSGTSTLATKNGFTVSSAGFGRRDLQRRQQRCGLRCGEQHECRCFIDHADDQQQLQSDDGHLLQRQLDPRQRCQQCPQRHQHDG